jgi:hypothetical protein
MFFQYATLDDVDIIMDYLEDTIREHVTKLSWDDLCNTINTLNAFGTTDEDPMWIQRLSTHTTLASLISSCLYGLSCSTNITSFVTATGSMYAGYIVLGTICIVLLRAIARPLKEDTYRPLRTCIDVVTSHVASIDHRTARVIRSTKMLESRVNTMEADILDRIAYIELRHSIAVVSMQLISSIEHLHATLGTFVGISSGLDSVLHSINTALLSVIRSIHSVRKDATENTSLTCISEQVLHVSNALRVCNRLSERTVVSLLHDVSECILHTSRSIQGINVDPSRIPIQSLRQELKRLDDNVYTLRSVITTLPQGFIRGAKD